MATKLIVILFLKNSTARKVCYVARIWKTNHFCVVQYGYQNSLLCDFNKIRWLLKIKIELKFQ